MKTKETLEETYDIIYKSIDFTEFDFASFTIGANWQKEQMYSEEEVLTILHKRDMYKWQDHQTILSLPQWFEKFIKK